MSSIASSPSAVAAPPLAMGRCPLPLLDDIYARRMIPVEGGRWEPMNTYIPRDQGDYLYALVRRARPAVTVEIGMANGLSTCFLAQGLADNGAGRHVAIDPFQRSDWKGAGLALTELAGLGGRVELVEKYSHQALPELEQRGVRAGLIFIDGSHLFDYVMADFLGADRILEVGGLMAFDDSDWPAINQALRYIVANRGYEVAFPEVVIEGHRNSPTLAGRLLRGTGKALPALGAKLRPDFLETSFDLGLRGRCVVLRKLREDDRDGQSRYHQTF